MDNLLITLRFIWQTCARLEFPARNVIDEMADCALTLVEVYGIALKTREELTEDERLAAFIAKQIDELRDTIKPLLGE